MFLINIPIVGFALVAGLVLVPESRDPHPESLDIPGAVLSIAAIATLVYAIIEVPVRGWTDSLVIAGFGGGAALVAAFVYWETRTEHPMLRLVFFKNPRFSAGAGAISIGFFSLFGMVFGLTQYLQFVQGYTPLEAGLRMVPVALGIAVGASISHRLVGRLGTNKVVAMGLVVLSGVLVTITLWQPDTDYWVIGLTFFVLAFGIGNLMAPSTDAVMGAVPEANAGIASAMNDVTRQVAGAFGVAVIGSVINTAYSGRMNEAVASLPPAAAQAATDSVGAALRVASRLPAEAAAGLVDAARVAFTDAFGVAVLVSAGTALVGAVLIARFMPARHLPARESVEPGGSPTASDLASPSQERSDGKVQEEFKTRQPQTRPTSQPGG